MQLQIEHVYSRPAPQSCVICTHPFQPNLARVVVYLDDQAQGDLCPTCLAQGANFVRTRLQTQLSDRISTRAA